jgi:transposase-like protein
MCWCLRYELSYRDAEELLAERGVRADHSTINRWVIKFLPALADAARSHKKPVGRSWRLDETYIKVRGKWKYLYRGADEDGDTIDFLLTAKRDKAPAYRFLRQAIKNNGEPDKTNIDRSGSNKAAIDSYNETMGSSVEARQCKYLNSIVEQDPRRVKQKMRAALGFKSFHSAHATIQSVEAVTMTLKGQVCPVHGGDFVQQFNALCA